MPDDFEKIRRKLKKLAYLPLEVGMEAAKTAAVKAYMAVHKEPPVKNWSGPRESAEKKGKRSLDVKIYDLPRDMERRQQKESFDNWRKAWGDYVYERDAPGTPPQPPKRKKEAWEIAAEKMVAESKRKAR